jgi:hypothetical protein
LNTERLLTLVSYLCAFGLAALALTVPLTAASAQAPEKAPSVAMDGKRKINFSGRQRMLSQYMAKAVCFASLGVDEKTQLEEMKFANFLFDQTLKDLRTGNSLQRMLPENDAAILAALDIVAAQWKVYGPAVLKRDIETVMANNVAVLTRMNEAVTLFQKKYGSANVQPETAAALNFSGRQRMLTQKASKEFCLIALGRDEAANRTNLTATIALFEKSMKGLRDGDASMGLKPAPETDIELTIDRAYQMWVPLREVLRRTADGATPSKEDIDEVSRRNVAVMHAMNGIVELYEFMAN